MTGPPRVSFKVINAATRKFGRQVAATRKFEQRYRSVCATHCDKFRSHWPAAMQAITESSVAIMQAININLLGLSQRSDRR